MFCIHLQKPPAICIEEIFKNGTMFRDKKLLFLLNKCRVSFTTKTTYGNGKESKRLLQHFEGSQASRSERSRIPITFNHAKTDALSWKFPYSRDFV